MKNKNKKKNAILVFLIVLILGMAVGYAAFSQTLTINGTANISSTWDVHFKSIADGTLVGATNVATYPKLDGTTTATFNVNLAYPGASATYNIVVENSGSVDAEIESIAGNLETANVAEPTGVTFTCDAEVGDKLAAGATKTYVVTATWDADDDTVPETTSKTVTITLNYVQDTTQGA